MVYDPIILSTLWGQAWDQSTAAFNGLHRSELIWIGATNHAVTLIQSHWWSGDGCLCRGGGGGGGLGGGGA